MRTVRFVMTFLIFLECTALAAQSAGALPDQSLDRVIVLLGRDETSLPLPAPWTQGAILIPVVDPGPGVLEYLPPVPAPVGDWSRPWPSPRTVAFDGDPLR
jgi:hypothetical protein